MTQKEILIKFLEWMNEVTTNNHMILETDNDDIAEMFLASTPAPQSDISKCIDPQFQILGCDMPKGSCPDCGKKEAAPQSDAVDWEQVFDDAQTMHQQEFISYYKNNLKQ